MKHLIIATTVALGLACVGSTSVAQDGSRTTNLQNVRVTAAQGQYETYVVDLHAGYQLEALVGNTHRQYLQARRGREFGSPAKAGWRSAAACRRGLRQLVRPRHRKADPAERPRPRHGRDRELVLQASRMGRRSSVPDGVSAALEPSV